MLKIIIAGSRQVTDMTILYQALNYALSQGFIPAASSYQIVSGGAKGVDTLARNYALAQGYDLKEFYPDYSLGPKAPLQRNQAMADYGDILIAVWDGISTGTAHMISCMKKLAKPVLIYRF